MKDYAEVNNSAAIDLAYRQMKRRYMLLNDIHKELRKTTLRVKSRYFIHAIRNIFIGDNHV